MKLFIFLLTVLTTAAMGLSSSDDHRNLQAFCPDGGCCADGFNDYEFDDIEKCSQRYILNRIELFINATIDDGATCANNRIQEARKATGTTNTGAAITALQAVCEEKIERCIDSTDDLEFASIPSCSANNILKELGKEEDCARGAKFEAQLLTGTNTWAAARNALQTQCKAEIDSCVFAKGEDVEFNGCDYTQIRNAINTEIENGNCARTATQELKFLTGTTSLAAAKTAINTMCANEWAKVKKTQFTNVDGRLNGPFMNEYRRGNGPFNTETGQIRDVTDYGRAIENFRNGDAQSTLLQAYDTNDDLAKCKFNSMMCCFGRDRQFGDDNGNCNEGDCEDADPADNADLCFTSKRFTYPNDKEGDVHCHGLAWGDDVNDYTQQLMFNNFFFVSLYDHFSQRGYVQRSVRVDEGNTNNFPMCGCIEQMPPATRSDCTQVDINAFTITFDGTSLSAQAPDDLNVQFNSCQGTTNNNDLHAYVDQLLEEKRLRVADLNKAGKKLVGKGQDNNNNDAASNASCAAAYEARFGQAFPNA